MIHAVNWFLSSTINNNCMYRQVALLINVIGLLFLIWVIPVACKKDSAMSGGSSGSQTNGNDGIIVAGTGGSGSTLNEFGSPVKLCLDGSGNLYVSDATYNRITKWTPGATQGVIVAGNSSAGDSLDELNSPRGIFVDGSGNLFVADQANNRVVEWTPGAT